MGLVDLVVAQDLYNKKHIFNHKSHRSMRDFSFSMFKDPGLKKQNGRLNSRNGPQGPGNMVLSRQRKKSMSLGFIERKCFFCI